MKSNQHEHLLLSTQCCTAGAAAQRPAGAEGHQEGVTAFPPIHRRTISINALVLPVRRHLRHHKLRKRHQSRLLCTVRPLGRASP